MANYPKISTIGSPGIEIDRLIEVAKDAEMMPAYYAILRESELASRPQLWVEPDYKEEEQVRRPVNFHLTDKEDFITRLAMEVSGVVKFPIATVHLHNLGVIAAAMTKSYSVEYNGELAPCNLFVVTGQPPSTGKSGVNSILFKPVREAFKRLNKSTAITRIRLQTELAIAEKSLDKIKNGNGGGGLNDLQIAITKVEDTKEELFKYPHWRCYLDDATIEAAEGVAAQQQGVFNIVSAEAEALDVLLGLTYGNKDGKKNFKLVLNSWDGEEVQSTRVTREGYDGEVRATIAVIAQNKTIESILGMGVYERGLPDRFLMLSEPNLLGSRKHGEKKKLNPKIMSDYEFLINNIVNESKVTIEMPSNLIAMVDDYRDTLEPLIKDGGDFDSGMLTGFVGKADKHIYKLACIYHVVDEWGVKGSKNRKISERALKRAITIFDELKNEYVTASVEYGFTGNDIQLTAIIEYLRFQSTKNKRLKIQWREFYDGVKKKTAFSGSRNISKKIKNDLLPILENRFFCRLHKGVLFINPRLK